MKISLLEEKCKKTQYIVYKIFFSTRLKKLLTICNFYTIMLKCKYTEVMYPKGGQFNEKNISAQEASQKERAWFQKENGYC